MYTVIKLILQTPSVNTFYPHELLSVLLRLPKATKLCTKQEHVRFTSETLQPVALITRIGKEMRKLWELGWFKVLSFLLGTILVFLLNAIDRKFSAVTSSFGDAISSKILSLYENPKMPASVFLSRSLFVYLEWLKFSLLLQSIFNDIDLVTRLRHKIRKSKVNYH